MKALKSSVNPISKKQYFVDKTGDFFYGNAYPIIMAFITVFCYVTNMQLGGLAIFIILGCYLLLITSDLTPILPLLTFLMMLFRDISVMTSPLFYVMVSPILVCFIIHVVKFPVKNFAFGQLFLPLCLVSLSLLFSGIFSIYVDNYVKGLLYTLPVGPVVLAVYLIFANYIQYPAGFDIRRYIFFVIALAGVVIMLEYWYMTQVKQMLMIGEFGWGNLNAGGTMLLMAIPAYCYFVVKSKYFFPNILLVLVTYFTIYSTSSDGALGVALFCLPFLAIFVYKYLHGNKKRFFGWLIVLVIAAALLTLVLLSLVDKIHLIYRFIINAVNGESGRNKLYNDALRVFKKYPLFGVGFGYYNDYTYSAPDDLYRLFNFHSTFFQTLGSMGLVGLIAYSLYYYERFKIILKRNTAFNLFVYFAFGMFACYGMVDCAEWSTIPCLITATLLLLCTEFANKHEIEPDFPLWQSKFIK